jgi:hypothetical protein
MLKVNKEISTNNQKIKKLDRKTVGEVYFLLKELSKAIKFGFNINKEHE